MLDLFEADRPTPCIQGMPRLVVRPADECHGEPMGQLLRRAGDHYPGLWPRLVGPFQPVDVPRVGADRDSSQHGPSGPCIDIVEPFPVRRHRAA